MRVAVIDMGTNTFNLLIADIINKNDYWIVYEDKIHVKLGKKGLTNNTITEEAIKRGLNAIHIFQKRTHEHKVIKTVAFATSALRNATNAVDFINQVNLECNLSIEIISGDKEAELIYKGINKSVELTEQKVLILDIGGGSNEFIIANKNTIFWKKSYDLGVTRLIELFNPSDPIKQKEIKRIFTYIYNTIPDLLEQIKIHKPKILIGASGSFESFFNMIDAKHSLRKLNQSSAEIDLKLLDELHNILIHSTINDRRSIPGLIEMRVENIVMASIFTKYIIEKCNITHLIQSDFALKDGVIVEMAESLNK